ncbi:hypothetical protein [Mycolicibacterium sediminis]|nr:hypothetical protein [Mycolicibacterium sediminis]
MGGIPLLVALILVALIYRRKGPHPATYELSQEWTHAPILWAAEEPADHGHADHGSHSIVGGGASGRW